MAGARSLPGAGDSESSVPKPDPLFGLSENYLKTVAVKTLRAKGFPTSPELISDLVGEAYLALLAPTVTKKNAASRAWGAMTHYLRGYSDRGPQMIRIPGRVQEQKLDIPRCWNLSDLEIDEPKQSLSGDVESEALQRIATENLIRRLASHLPYCTSRTRCRFVAAMRLVAQGHTIRDAAQSVGIHEQSIYALLAKIRKRKKGGKKGELESVAEKASD